MATLRDVAERSGVTVTTISRMMNGRGNVSAKTRAKIEAAMKELDYHPNELARSLAKKTTNFIGLIVPSAMNYFFASVIQSVEAYASAHGCKLLLCVSNRDVRKEKEYFSMLLGNKVMGIILANFTQNAEDFLGINAPMVIIEREPSPHIPCALTDNYHGGYIAAEHLISKGCKKLLFFHGKAELDTDPDKRFIGFRDACQKHGVELPVQVDATWSEFISMNYDGTIGRLFREYPQADGILASNDIMAVGILRYCRRHQIPVPERLKVVGYDDTPFAVNCAMPLTTIHQPIDELCRFAVECILRISSGEVVPTKTVFPVSLVEREST
ncbi:MAG: LacI family transcriptional regulator [Clostridiales bacterium]|nr:LacI family transcriptional regulator [Clostridiales bacterium]